MFNSIIIFKRDDEEPLVNGNEVEDSARELDTDICEEHEDHK